ncbi:hypothetical protein CYMTET_23452 [Cymbomonas tetramitiformis]|uniref:Uncharacterized protein n=1 Tax=Cymbomonas tetramitiformis TaxID=36881 RepID=A0AAE0L134_9CHLO|nr:hypothetical protein CYMTET_23452 [Cymbomonas tetramitiformis]
MHTLALCQIFQVVADDGAEAFAAAAAEYGAPAVLAGGESDDIDVSTGLRIHRLQLRQRCADRAGDPHQSGYHYGVPTKEFPGGVELVPDWLLQVVGSTLTAGDPAVTGGGTAAATSVYGGVSTNGEP